MSEIDREKSYFQKIAQRFFFWTGQKPFLSSKDSDLIHQWKKLHIPLSIVLEGIDRAFEKISSVKKRKINSLYFCQKHVLQLYAQFREGQVGAGKPEKKEDKKKSLVIKEITHFLTHLPPDLFYLRSCYEQALVLIQEGKEEALEELDDQVETLLFNREAETWGELNNRKQEILRKNIIKDLRKKFKIPYLSFYYY